MVSHRVNMLRLSWMVLLFGVSVNSVKVGVMLPPEAKQVRMVYDAVMYPYNGTGFSLEPEFKVGTFFGHVQDDDIFTTTRELCDQLRHQVTSVILSSLTHTSKSLQSMFKNTNIPYVTTSYQDHCRSDLHGGSRRSIPPSDKMGISIMPDFIPAIADTIDHYQWKSFIYIYNSDTGTQKWQRLLSYKYRQTDVTMRYAKRISKVSEATEFLKQVDSADRDSNKYVILDMSYEKAKDVIIRHARDAHVGKRNFHFVLANPIVNEMQHQLIPEFSVVNITAFKLTGMAETFRTFTDRLSQSGDISQWSDIREEQMSVDQALIHDAASLLLQTYKGLTHNGEIPRKHSEIFSAFTRIGNTVQEGHNCAVEKLSVASELGEIISRHMRQQSLQGLTGKLEFNKEGCRKNYVIDIIKLAKDGKLVQIGQWEYGKGFSTIVERIERDKETKVNHQRTYIISTLLEEPFLEEKEEVEQEDDKRKPVDPNSKFQGYLKDLADEVAKMLGIRYELRVAKDGQLGRKSNNALGGWSGVVGEVVREEADLGLVSNPVKTDLREVIDYSKPFMYTGTAAIASKKITPDCLQILITFLKPFGWPLWIMIASSFGIVFLSMFIFSLCVASADCRKGIEHTFCDDVYNSLVFTVDAFIPHYLDSYYARSIAGRVISNFWWIFILLVFSAYTAQLVPLLKSERATLFNPSLTNISQLADQDTIKFAYARQSPAERYFNVLRNNNSTMDRIAESIRRQSMELQIMSEAEGVEKVRNDNESFVFFMDSNKADFINSRAPCDTFRVEGRPLGVKGVAAILPKDSYLRQEIDLAITQLSERGTLDKLYKKWWVSKSNCTGTHRSLPVMGENLHLYNFIGVLAIPSAGIAVGFILAFFEICYRACTRGRRIRQLKRAQLAVESRGDAGSPTGDPGFSNITKEEEQLNLQTAYTQPA